jgi:hypothetical protein
VYFDRIISDLRRGAKDAGLLAKVDSFDWEAWAASLEREYRVLYGNVVLVQAAREARNHGLTPFDRDDPFVQRSMTDYVTARVKQLEAHTREEVKSLVQSAIEAGAGSVPELRDKLMQDVLGRYDGYAQWRAQRIAQTETAIAYNHGSVYAYRHAGVSRVLVSDSDDDEECSRANGQIWTLAQALANPTAHPNCTRAFSPIIDGE